MVSLTSLEALVAGFATFFSSCLTPLVPLYLVYLAGQEGVSTRKQSVRQAIYFVLGFIITYALLGLFAGTLGLALRGHLRLIEQIGALVLWANAGLILGVLRWTVVTKERRMTLPVSWLTAGSIGSLLLGVTFGVAWTPCIGPTLAVILYLASQQESFYRAAWLLAVFGIGLGIPFLFVAAFYEVLAPLLRRLSPLSRLLQVVVAVFMLYWGYLLWRGSLL